MTDLHELFCLNLISLRNKKPLTQEKMAEKLRIGVRSYQKIEYGYKTGTHAPSFERIKQLAKVLKCDTVDFFKPVKKA